MRLERGSDGKYNIIVPEQDFWPMKNIGKLDWETYSSSTSQPAPHAGN